jgi:hypothetical protein
MIASIMQEVIKEALPKLRRETPPEKAARLERERCVAVIEFCKPWLGESYIPIWNRIANPDYDPRDRRDRFDGF